MDDFPKIVFSCAIIISLPVIATFLYWIYLWISSIVETAKSSEMNADEKNSKILKTIAGGVLAIAFIWLFGGVIGGIIIVCGVVLGLSYWWI